GAVVVRPSSSQGASTVSSLKTNTKSATIASPRTMPSAIPIRRSPRCTAGSDPVEQAPVRLVGGLGDRDQPVLVGRLGQLLDQLAHLGRVLHVTARVNLEVGGSGAVGEPVALEQALPLGARDLRLRDLDRVQASE